MCELIGIGDLHMTDDKGQGGLAKYIPDHDALVISEVERILRWGAKRGITNIVFYGDVCENPRASYSMQVLLTRLFRAWSEMVFYIILGNHDKEGEDSAMGHSLEVLAEQQIPNVRIFTEDKVVAIDGTKVKMCPWPSTAFNPTMLNIGHKEVWGSKLDSGRLTETEGLSKSKAVVLMGHLHTAHRVRNTYFSGTIYQTNFGESLPKYFHHVVFTSPEDYEVELIPFEPRYKLFNCVAESQEDIEALPRDPRHLIKLVIKDGADVVIPDLPNIVVTKAFKTKTELETILTEDLIHGTELVLRTDEFFKSWLQDQQIPASLKKRVRQLRRDVLGSK